MSVGRTTCGALAVAICVSSTSPAQSVAHALGNDASHSAGDIWAVWTSPFHSSGKDWLLAGGALAAWVAVSPIDATADQWAAQHQSDAIWTPLAPLRERGIASSGQAITPLALGALAVALAKNNQRLQEGLFGCTAAYSATSAVRTFVVYPLIARTRPDSALPVKHHEQPPPPPAPAHPGDQYHISVPGGHDWGRQSIPGGHLVNVTACATFLTQRFTMGAMEPVAWAVVGGVALSRVLDRRHWLSDQVIGAVFGYAAGRVIAVRSSHRVDRPRSQPVTTNAERYAPPIFLDRQLFVQPQPFGTAIGWAMVF